MPNLSVLMSAYKCGDTVGLAVRSTLRAMPPDSELVVAVDGPDEPTEAALAAIHDRRLKVRVSPQNRGLANQLVALTDGTDSRVVARMDSDDICLPWRFAATLPALRRNDFVFGAGVRFGRDRNPRLSYPLSLNAYEVGFSLLFFNPLFHPSMACHREALEGVGGYATIAYGEDNELWLRAAAAGRRLYKVGTPVICYRLSPGQMSAGDGVDDRLLREPRFQQERRRLADRLGLESHLDQDQVLHLDAAALDRVLADARPENRHYFKRQLSRSSLVSLD